MPDYQSQLQRRTGFANWTAYLESGRTPDVVLAAAAGWARHFVGIEKPWLCWNVHDDWCWVQQQMAVDAGWTPVVGYDPRVGPPRRRVKSAVVVDFNEGLGLPTLHPVFPMEFVWLYAPRLAFWHSDLIVRPEMMREIAGMFDRIASGETIAVDPRLTWSRFWSKYRRRYWELIGCTTREASKDQYERGCGWWRHIESHPNCPPAEREERARHFWDHGVGIRYWAKTYAGVVRTIPERWVAEGHCTQINNPNYVRVSPNDDRKNLSQDLVANFRLDEVCRRLGRAGMLPPLPAPAPAVVASPREATQRAKTQVYITVDVESSMGGAWANPALRPVPPSRRIFCDIDGKSHGIGWLTQELNARGMRGTFFCEVFSAKVFGESETRRWIGHLVDAGQDVQLHTHLNYHYYAQYLASGTMPSPRIDSLARLPSALMRERSEEAVDLFERHAGCRPQVYRGGSWVCSSALLSELARVGILLDTSFNPDFKQSGSFTGEALLPNALQRAGSMWELPVTVAHQHLPERSLQGNLRPLDPTSMSVAELQSALEQAHAAGMEHVCIVLHCFSGVKPADKQYTSMRPDHVVRRRLAGLLDFLQHNPDRFTVSTLGELAANLSRAATPPMLGSSFVPELGFIKPLARKVVQGVNRLV